MSPLVITLIVIGSILGLALLLYITLFIVFISNGDGKMIEKVYNALLKHHDKAKKEEKI